MFADVARAERAKLAHPEGSPAPDALSPSNKLATMPFSQRQQCVTRTLADSELKYCVSSVRSPDNGNTYGASNLFGASATAWVPESSGYAVGAWITIEFDRARKVAGISIRNGYQKNSDIFQKNSRVRALDVRTAEGDEMRIELRDQPGSQQVGFPHPVMTNWMAFTIRSVYSGAKYTDTAVSKLDVNFAD